MEREKFKSRLGFILISAGCAMVLEMYGVFLMLLEIMAVDVLYYFTSYSLLF